MTCDGCGRLLGLRSEADCPCWLSYSPQAIVPDRLQRRTRQVRMLREKKRHG